MGEEELRQRDRMVELLGVPLRRIHEVAREEGVSLGYASRKEDVARSVASTERYWRTAGICYEEVRA